MFLKYREILKYCKSEQNPLKNLEELTFGKVAGPQHANLSKIKLIYNNFSVNLSAF